MIFKQLLEPIIYDNLVLARFGSHEPRVRVESREPGVAHSLLREVLGVEREVLLIKKVFGGSIFDDSQLRL